MSQTNLVPPARAWGIRTARAFRERLTGEATAGRLRQGWGWDNSQDLGLLTDLRDRDGLAAFSPAQRAAWRGNQRLATGKAGAVAVGDWVVTPHLPVEGQLGIWRVVGDYRWDPIATPVHPEGFAQDFGHVVPVEFVASGINPANAAVPAGLRGRLRSRGRMFTLDDFIPVLVELAGAAGDDSATLSTSSALDDRLRNVRRAVDEALFAGLKKEVDHAHMEELAVLAVEQLFPGATSYTGGPNEQGADVFVEQDNGPLNLPNHIVVQVKNWYSDHGTGGLEHLCGQLETAIRAYENVTGAVAFTLLDAKDVALDADAMEPFAQLEERTGVPVRVLSKQDVVELILPVLLERTSSVA